MKELSLKIAFGNSEILASSSSQSPNPLVTAEIYELRILVKDELKHKILDYTIKEKELKVRCKNNISTDNDVNSSFVNYSLLPEFKFEKEINKTDTELVFLISKD